MTYANDLTGLVVIDPYNDFISPSSSLNRATSSPKSIGVLVVSPTPTWIYC